MPLPDWGHPRRGGKGSWMWMLGEPGDWSQTLRWRRGASKDQRRDTQLQMGQESQQNRQRLNSEAQGPAAGQKN